jgi:TRAP-type C4-dicarboxylate transport system permease small subunit
MIWIGVILLSAMIVLTCLNVFLRKIWVPIPGTFELIKYFSAVAMAFALAHAQISKTHIAVDVLVLRFSPNVRKILNAFNALICFAFFALVAWQISRYATTLLKTGEVSETLRIIYYPFTYAVSAGTGLLALIFIREIITIFQSKREEG